MLLQLSIMLSMNMTEEENLARVVLLIDIGFATDSLLLCSEFD